MAKKNKGGRPPKYATEEKLSAMIDAYWAVCESLKRLPNKAGLCLHLDISRDTYSEYRTKFPDTIKAADLEIEHAWVGRLEGNSPTGAIFYLKNAFKEEYKDRHENDNMHRFDKLEVDDIRALLSVLPKAEQEKYYELIAKLAATAASAGGRSQGQGHPLDRSGDDTK